MFAQTMGYITGKEPQAQEPRTFANGQYAYRSLVTYTWCLSCLTMSMPAFDLRERHFPLAPEGDTSSIIQNYFALKKSLKRESGTKVIMPLLARNTINLCRIISQ